jgi:hypothetical protein
MFSFFRNRKSLFEAFGLFAQVQAISRICIPLFGKVSLLRNLDFSFEILSLERVIDPETKGKRTENVPWGRDATFDGSGGDAMFLAPRSSIEAS